MDILKGVLALLLGFGIYILFSHPRYQKKRVPKIRLGKVQILPNLRIRLKSGTVRLHHWIILGAILGFLNHAAQGIGNLILIKLFTLGGIVQGLTFRDRFKIFWKKPVRYLSYYPTISVVIPAYNEQADIAHVIGDLKKQNYKGKFEIIVCDNGSTDKTAEIAKNLGAKVVTESQKGVTFARQTGFGAARSEIIASTDADSRLPVNWLTTLASEFQKKPQTVAVSGMFDFYDGSVVLRALTYLFNFPMFCIFSWYSGANMAVRREAYDKVGGFDVAVPISEDSDLAVRLRDVGKVVRLANFKVKTSARRFNKLGLVGGLWDYTTTYARSRFLYRRQHNIVFRSGTEVPRIAFLPKLAIHMIVVISILAITFGTVLQIKPVKAQAIKRRHQLTHQISKIDIDLPTLPHVHHFHHK